MGQGSFMKTRWFSLTGRELLVLLIAAGLGTFGSVWVIHNKAGIKGFIGLAAFLGLALIVHLLRKPGSARS